MDSTTRCDLSMIRSFKKWMAAPQFIARPDNAATRSQQSQRAAAVTPFGYRLGAGTRLRNALPIRALASGPSHCLAP